MSKPQLQQAPVLVILPDIKSNAQQQCCIKEMASKLATGSSSSTAVGERGGRTHHDRARVLASPPRATRATRPTAWPARAETN